MPEKSHDLEFHVSDEKGTASATFHDFDKACGFAVARYCNSGVAVHVDVVTKTREAARKWGGDARVETYDADPEASVHERLVIKSESLGRVS